MIPRLTHVTFSVLDFDESIRFYKKWLGLAVHRDRRPKGTTVWLTTEEQNRKSVPDFIFVLEEGPVSRINHFGFQVPSRERLDDLARRAKEEGVWLEGPVDIGGDVGSYVFIQDPNGHVWEYTFGQPLAGL